MSPTPLSTSYRRHSPGATVTFGWYCPLVSTTSVAEWPACCANSRASVSPISAFSTGMEW